MSKTWELFAVIAVGILIFEYSRRRNADYEGSTELTGWNRIWAK
tara:strand:+ start:5261 stop:5392 length:132 start_codon:yes stop_codon:yes gene_type:complete